MTRSVIYQDPQRALEQAQDLYQREGCGACRWHDARRGDLACYQRRVPVLGWCSGFESDARGGLTGARGDDGR